MNAAALWACNTGVSLSSSASNAKENSLFQVTHIYLFLAAFAIFLLVIMAICAFLMNRGRDSSYTSEYFGPNYQNDLQRHSDMSETEDRQSEYQSRFTPFRLRDPNAEQPKTKSNVRQE
jgi:hypothetical protein